MCMEISFAVMIYSAYLICKHIKAQIPEFSDNSGIFGDFLQNSDSRWSDSRRDDPAPTVQKLLNICGESPWSDSDIDSLSITTQI